MGPAPAEGDDMVYRATSGLVDSLLGLRLSKRGSLSGLCVETGSILQCDDSEVDDRVDILDPFAGVERDPEKLRYFQARERAVYRAGVCVQP